MTISKFETNSKHKLYFKESSIKPKEYNPKLENKVINVYPDVKYQSFIGFGGAITEAAGYSFSRLPKEKQEEFIKDCFSEEGLSYNFCRLPIGSTDFSTHSYSYSNQKDLTDFSIDEDKKNIFPLLEKAIEKNKNIKFLSSPWSPPRFMKSTKLLTLGGKLKDEFKETYANYLCKYIKKMELVLIILLSRMNQMQFKYGNLACIQLKKKQALQ